MVRRTRATAGASPLAAELPAPTRPRRRKATTSEAEAAPPAKRAKHLDFATERVVSSPIPSPAVERVKSPAPAASSPAIEREDGEPTPAATGEASRPRAVPRRRLVSANTTPPPPPHLPFTAPPTTNTTVAEDFAGLLPAKMTPRPYALKMPMVRPGQLARERPAEKAEKELFAASDSEDDNEASIHEEEYPHATAQEIKETGRLVLNVNNAYHQHQRHLKILKEKGLGGRKTSVRNSAEKSVRKQRSTSPDQYIIQVKEVVEKVVTVPGPSMPAEFPQNTLIIPASASGDQMILTDPRIIELARAAAVFLTSNPSHQLPHPSQMTEFLQRFSETGAVDSLVADNHPTNNQYVDPFDALVTDKPNSDDHDNLPAGTTFLMGKAYDEHGMEIPCEIAMTNGLGSRTYTGEGSEVKGPASSPFIATPAQLQNNTPIAATSDSNRGFFGSVKSMVTSPLKKFGIVGTPRGSTTENDVGMANQTPYSTPRMGNDAPATIDRFGITPSTDINFSPTDLRDPKSPTPFNKRIQNKRMANKRNASILKCQKKEVQHAHDNLTGDVHREKRGKKRVAFMARDEVRNYTPVTPDDSTPPTKQKRKRAPKAPKPPKPPVYENSFCVPDDSETSTEEEEEAESPDEESPAMYTTSGSQYNGTYNNESQTLNNGPRIDSHHDESSTTPTVLRYNNGRRNNGRENFLKLQDEQGIPPTYHWIMGKRIDVHRGPYSLHPSYAYDQYATEWYDVNPPVSQSPFSQTVGTSNNTSGNVSSDAFTSSRQSGSGMNSHDSHHDESSNPGKAPRASTRNDASIGSDADLRSFTSQDNGSPMNSTTVDTGSQSNTHLNPSMNATTIGTGSQVDSHLDESARSAQASGSGFIAPLNSTMNATTVGTGSQVDSHLDESARSAQTSDSQIVVAPGHEDGFSSTYSFPDIDYSDSESDGEGEEEPVVPEVLGEKENAHEVPAPPRPANAVLPPPYNKYVPEKKSFLSFMEIMSPMQVADAQKENDADKEDDADKENNSTAWQVADDTSSPSISQERDPEEYRRQPVISYMENMSQDAIGFVNQLPDAVFPTDFVGIASFD